MIYNWSGTYKLACEMKKRFRLESIAKYYNSSDSKGRFRKAAELALYNKAMIEFRRKYRFSNGR